MAASPRIRQSKPRVANRRTGGVSPATEGRPGSRRLSRARNPGGGRQRTGAQCSKSRRGARDDGELRVKSGAVNYCGRRAIGLRPFRQIAVGRGGEDRAHHRLRGAAERAFPDRGSGLGLPARRAAARRSKSRSCWSRSSRTCSKGSMPRSRKPGCSTIGCGCGDHGALQRVSLQLQRPDRLLACWSISARARPIFFSSSRGKFFRRSVPIGGSSISAAIAKEFDEPVGAAEFRKKRDGFVSLGGAYAEPADPEVARVVEDRAQHDDATARGIDALDQPLPRATARERAGARFSLRREREHALHARVFSRETAVADRVLSSAAQRRRGGRVESGGSGALRAFVRRTGRPGAAQRDRPARWS